MRRGVRRRLARILPPTQGVRPAQPSPPRVLRLGTGRRGILLAAALAGIVATVLSGPIAGALATLYASIGAVVLRRARLAKAAGLRRSAALDAVADAAAALRAGAGPLPLPDLPEPAIAAKVAAAVSVAEQTGAPLADLLDRIEAEHRFAARARTRAAAEAAGARTTAALLLLLPVGGIALGGLIGVDSLDVLLHTPIGGACALTAALLQLGGLAWVARISATRPARRAQQAERERARRDLPLAAELLAAVLRAGVPVDAGVLAVAAALPLGERLTRVGRALRLGASAAGAWRHLSDLDGASRLVTTAVRSAGSGGALAAGLHRIAGDLRADEADRVEARARRAAVLLVLPLGLCFLPAFVLAGLTPVVIAVVGELSP